MISKAVLLLFLICGIILIVIEVTRVDRECSKQKVVFRYIPRTFNEEQNEPVYPSQIFQSMFTQPTAWIRGIYDYDFRKAEAVNKFFVSQM